MNKALLFSVAIFCAVLIACKDSGSGITNNYYTTTSDNTTSTTSDNTTSTTSVVFIYPYSVNPKQPYVADSVVNTCAGITTSGYIKAPFYSTSTTDLKNRLPLSKWSSAVYSMQMHKISSSWENLWDGNLEMSLHQAEVLYDNGTSENGFWTGTKSDGTFSGNNCRDWSI